MKSGFCIEGDQMNREKKILLVSISFAVAGWFTAAEMATSVGAFKLRAMNAEADAADWKRQAGKAYTEMLQARAVAKSTAVQVPAGARIDCTMKTTSKCEDGTIYPPQDY
jgi:hypothetical protein